MSTIPKLQKAIEAYPTPLPPNRICIDLANLQKLAEGRCGIVFQCVAFKWNDPNSKELMVLKSAVTDSSGAPDPEMIYTFENEEACLTALFKAKVRHIVPTFYPLRVVFTNKYLSMYRATLYPHCGEPLWTLDTNTIRLQKIQSILTQLLETLQDLTITNMIHGDLKTDNILMQKDALTVIDWGLSRRNGMVMTGSITTLHYRAPECIFNETVGVMKATHSFHLRSPAMDMWSLGCVFWELVVGASLFDFSIEREQVILNEMIALLHYPPHDLSKTARNLSLKLPQQVMHSGPNRWRLFTTELTKKDALPLKAKLGLDLIQKMLTWRPCERITPSQALQHPFLKKELSLAAPEVSSSSSSSGVTSKTNNET